MVYRYQWLSTCSHYDCGCSYWWSHSQLFGRLQMNDLMCIFRINAIELSNSSLSIHRNRDKMAHIRKPHFKCTFIKEHLLSTYVDYDSTEGFAYKMHVESKNNCKTSNYLTKNALTWHKIPQNNVFDRSWLLVARRWSGGKPLPTPIIILFADLYIGQNLV